MNLVKNDKAYYAMFVKGRTVRWRDGRKMNPRLRTGTILFVEEDGVQVFNEVTQRSYFLKRQSMKRVPEVDADSIDFKKGSIAAEKIE